MKPILLGVLLVPLAFAAHGADYFPPPESASGWRTLDSAEDIRRISGMDPAKLNTLKRWLLESDKRNFAAVVIRRGYVVLETRSATAFLAAGGATKFGLGLWYSNTTASGKAIALSANYFRVTVP